MGVMCAFFHSFGTTPSLRDFQYSNVKGLDSSLLASISTLGCRPSGPGDMLVFTFELT